MSVAKFVMMMGSTGARYIAGATYDTSGATQAVPLSAYRAGDVVLIIVTSVSGTPSLSGATGWGDDEITWASFGYKTTGYWKQLEAGDLAGVTVILSGVGAGAMSVLVVGYRGATTATLKSSAETTGSTLGLTGFTKAQGSRRVVSYVADRDTTGSPAPPAAWVNRLGPTVSNFWTVDAADISPANYVDGTTVTWTGFATSSAQVGFLYELT